VNLQTELGVYAYFDGDDVGANIELRLLEDDVDGASRVSSRVSKAIQWLGACLEREYSGQIKFAAGDEVLALLVHAPSKEQIEQIRSEFETRSGLSVSCGIGDSAREAAGQLRLAKLRGKNRTEGAANG